LADHFLSSSDKIADQRPRKEYVPRKVQQDPETVTNDDEIPEENLPYKTGMSGLTVHKNFYLV